MRYAEAPRKNVSFTEKQNSRGLFCCFCRSAKALDFDCEQLPLICDGLYEKPLGALNVAF